MDEPIDWALCPLVEVNRRVLSGAPVLRRTRRPVSAILDNFDYGVSVAEISEQFEVREDRIPCDSGLRQEPPRGASCLMRMSQSVCAAFLPGTKSVPSSK